MAPVPHRLHRLPRSQLPTPEPTCGIPGCALLRSSAPMRRGNETDFSSACPTVAANPTGQGWCVVVPARRQGLARPEPSSTAARSPSLDTLWSSPPTPRVDPPPDEGQHDETGDD